MDLNSDNQVDAIKLTFNQNILDSSIDILSSWTIGGFSKPYTLATGIASDNVDDEVVHITFAQNGTLITGSAFNVNTGGEYISAKDGLSGISSVWNANTTN